MTPGLALRTVFVSVRQVAGNLTLSFLSNLAATVLCIPLLLAVIAAAYAVKTIAVVPVGFMVILAVLPNPFAAGVQYAMRGLAHRDSVYARDQWQGFRTYFFLAFKCWLVSMVVTAVILGNLVFYAHASAPAARLIEALWISVLPLWLGIHLYVFPLIMEQEVKRTFLFYRNALIMTVFRPTFTLIVGICWLLVLFFTSATALLTIVGLALGASIQHHAAAAVLETFDRPVAGSKDS